MLLFSKKERKKCFEAEVDSNEKLMYLSLELLGWNKVGEFINNSSNIGSEK